jgi:geranylgeranyl diphosphate synthase type I
VASLKTGAYTVEGPLHIGAMLAGGSPELLAALSRFARPLGLAFQFRDDLFDHGEVAVPGATASEVNRLIDEARSALGDAAIAQEAAAALGSLAAALALADG